MTSAWGISILLVCSGGGAEPVPVMRCRQGFSHAVLLGCQPRYQNVQFIYNTSCLRWWFTSRMAQCRTAHRWLKSTAGRAGRVKHMQALGAAMTVAWHNYYLNNAAFARYLSPLWTARASYLQEQQQGDIGYPLPIRGIACHSAEYPRPPHMALQLRVCTYGRVAQFASVTSRSVAASWSDLVTRVPTE